MASIRNVLFCKDCQYAYEFTESEQQYFNAQGWGLPVRCPSCRKKKKMPMILVCSACYDTFEFTASQQRRFKTLGWVPPRRCKSCRCKSCRDQRIYPAPPPEDAPAPTSIAAQVGEFLQLQQAPPQQRRLVPWSGDADWDAFPPLEPPAQPESAQAAPAQKKCIVCGNPRRPDNCCSDECAELARNEPQPKCVVCHNTCYPSTCCSDACEALAQGEDTYIPCCICRRNCVGSDYEHIGFCSRRCMNGCRG